MKILNLAILSKGLWWFGLSLAVVGVIGLSGCKSNDPAELTNYFDPNLYNNNNIMTKTTMN